jgi:hypothetical protein
MVTCTTAQGTQKHTTSCLTQQHVVFPGALQRMNMRGLAGASLPFAILLQPPVMRLQNLDKHTPGK